MVVLADRFRNRRKGPVQPHPDGIRRGLQQITARRAEPCPLRRCLIPATKTGAKNMKGLIAWGLGVPVVVIIVFYLTGIF